MTFVSDIANVVLVISLLINTIVVVLSDTIDTINSLTNISLDTTKVLTFWQRAKEPPLAWIFGILLAVIATLLGSYIWRKLTYRFDGICKNIKKITPRDLNVQKPSVLSASEKEYIEIFAERPQDEVIKNAITNGKSVLILGKMLQGKSRGAFQVLNNMKNNLKRFWFIRPDLRPDFKNIPRKKNVIIYLDDLNKYANAKFDLTGFVRNFKGKSIIVATCRIGDEYFTSSNHFLHEIEPFEKIKLEDINKTQAEDLARRTNANISDFNGTPGSVILGLERVRQKIQELTDNQRSILRALKFLTVTNIYSPKVKILKEVSISIFNVELIKFEDDLKILKETGLIEEEKNFLKIGYDKYLDFIEYHFDQEDVYKLESILFKIKERNGLLSLSSWYNNNNFFDKCIESCTKVIELDPESYLGYAFRGIAYENIGNVDNAISDETHAIELEPNLLAYHVRGNAFQEKGIFDKAIFDFTKEIEFSPEHECTYVYRGIAYRDNGELEKAIIDFNKAIELNPNLVFAYYNRGDYYDSKGEIKKAFDDYNRAIELDPQDACVYCHRGVAYYNKGKFEKAFADMTKSIQLKPQDCIYNTRGDLYAEKGEFDKAIIDYTKSIELNQKYGSFLKRGNAYYEKGEYDKAIMDYTKSIELNQNDSSFFKRGFAYYEKGEYDLSIADFTKAIELNPKWAAAYNNRGNLFRKKGEFDKAIPDFEKALEYDSKLAIAMSNTGNVYAQLKDIDKAKFWYGEAEKNKEKLTKEQKEELIQWQKELEE